MNPETVFGCHSRLDLVRFLRQLHHNTGASKYQMPVCQLRMQSLFLCWDLLMHDVQLVDTTCTDQDEDEERDVVTHELRQPQSDASWTSEDETRNVRSVVLARCQVYPGVSAFHPSAKRISLSSCPSCLCHETLQAFDQWMAEPSRQKHQCQQQENSLWHS